MTVTAPLPMHDPAVIRAVIRGAKRVQAWREDEYPSYRVPFLVADLDVRHWLRATGWPGTDGSSFSFDSIQGVRVGLTGGQMNRLPATLHDVGYELVRRFRPPGRVRERIDQLYRDECIRRLREKLVPGSLSCRVGVLQAHLRYAALRAFGWRATRPRG